MMVTQRECFRKVTSILLAVRADEEEVSFQPTESVLLSQRPELLPISGRSLLACCLLLRAQQR